MKNYLILHIPHSSTDLGEITYSLSEEKLKEELFYSTDWFTDELFDFELCTRIVFNKSRLYIDVERFNDERETMGSIGRGIKYTRTFYNELLKKNVDYSIEPYIRHHEELECAVEQSLSVFEKIYIIDCHAFNDDIQPNTPDICIGFNVTNCDAQAITNVEKIFQDHGYTVEKNYPYLGSIIPDLYVEHPNVFTMMIEINKRVYMANEEFVPHKGQGFENIKNVIFEALKSIQHQ